MKYIDKISNIVLLMSLTFGINLIFLSLPPYDSFVLASVAVFISQVLGFLWDRLTSS